jgi:hypothetical protein
MLHELVKLVQKNIVSKISFSVPYSFSGRSYGTKVL